MSWTAAISRENRAKGFSLVELMISVGVTGVIVAGAAAIITTLMKETTRLNAKSGVQEFREAIIDLLLNDVALKNMIEATASMECLKNGASCTGEGGSVTVFTRNNELFYDAAAATSGFTSDGVACPAGVAFDGTGAGNLQCPYRLDLRWEPICDPSGCMAPQILFTGEVKVNAPSDALKQAGIGPSLNIRIVRNTGVRPSAIVAIKSGRNTTCALYNDGNQGRVKCWGRNEGRTLGNGSTTTEGTASYVIDAAGNPITNVKQIELSDDTACGVTGDGRVYCWGDGYMGSAGRGRLNPVEQYNRADFVLISMDPPNDTTLAPLTGMSEVHALRSGFCASSSTRIYCWGATYQLATQFHISAHSDIYGQRQQYTSWLKEWFSLAADITPQLGGATWSKFFAYETTLCLLMGPNKELSCWGSNQFGNLAYTPTDSGAERGCNPPSPTPPNAFCGITGIFGDYSFNANRKISAVGNMSNPSGATTGPTLQNVKDLQGGEKHLCALLDSGEVVCWGYNSHGQIGDGTYLGATTSPPAWTLNCLEVRNGVSFTRAAYIRNEFYWKWASCTGIDTNGDGSFREDDLIWTWEGKHPEVAIAHPRPAYVLDPSGAGRLSNIVQLDSQFDHTCAVDNLGDVYCWGFNGGAQVGTGSPTNVKPYGEPRPRRVTVLPAGTKATMVTTGEGHSCALTEEGKVYCWGDNWTGQLGVSSSSLPWTMTAVEVPNLEP